jgi:hypothetical protein
MILPIMLALGWSEQLLAVEWHKIDLAVFSASPTIPDKCILIFEAKGLDHGLQNVRDQLIGNARRPKLKLSNCRKAIATDGIRWYLYQKVGDSWDKEPSGYMNIGKIRTNHIAPAGTNAVDTLISMTPARIAESLQKSG